MAASPLETPTTGPESEVGRLVNQNLSFSQRRSPTLCSLSVNVINGPNIILVLKAAVILVTILWLASLVALVAKRYRLHGRINLAFMVLTLGAVFGLEFLIRVYDPKMFDYFDEATRRMMAVHLCFSVPAAVLLPVMYVTGRTGRSRLHYGLAAIFSVCWIGTFITGIFYLPHAGP